MTLSLSKLIQNFTWKLFNKLNSAYIKYMPPNKIMNDAVFSEISDSVSIMNTKRFD
jgi:hypothetical protein